MCPSHFSLCSGADTPFVPSFPGRIQTFFFIQSALLYRFQKNDILRVTNDMRKTIEDKMTRREYKNTRAYFRACKNIWEESKKADENAKIELGNE